MRIILAVDDPEIAEQAARAVIAQYRPERTEIRVMHVLQPIAVSTPPQMSADYAPELAEERKRAKKLVTRISDMLSGANFKARGVIETGDVKQKILEAADVWAADLVVLGSHAKAGVQTLLLGSVAEYVTRNAPCSVEIIRRPLAA